jgi:hypothetical protein
MKAVAAVAVIAAFAAAPAFADQLVARQGNDSVRLSDTACQSELVLGRIEAATRQEYRAASAVFQGQNFTACWRMVGNVAHLVYEDGDQGIIPAQELKAELST